jgi:transcriptional regulator with XRE-family HTH domain
MGFRTNEWRVLLMIKRVADTRLAQWLNKAMRDWQDPETHVYGISQNQLGRDVGISQSVINQILKDGHIPRYEVLAKLAHFFDTNVVYLYKIAYTDEDVSEVVVERLEQLQEVLDPLPVAVQAEFLGNVINQAEMYEVANAAKASANG